MTDLEKMMAFHAMQNVKELPKGMQDFSLVMLCKMDKTGRFERWARIFAEHKMPTNEIVPCIMDFFQDMLIDYVGGDENVLGQGDQAQEGAPPALYGE